MSTASRATFVAATFALLLAPRLAHADPSAEAQSQLRRGFEYCDDANAKKYFFQRDFAFKVDPTIKAWTGTIKKYEVQASIARCDAAMTKQQADDEKEAVVSKAFQEMRNACFHRDHAKYPGAKADFLAKNGGPSFAYEKGKDAKDEIARCDKELAEDKAHREKNEADQKRREEEYQAQQKASAEREKKERAAEDAVWAKLKGDRLAVAKSEGGLPTSPAYGKVPGAGKWVYAFYRGGQGEFQGWLCTTTYTFKGNKKTSKKQVGKGCSL